MGKIAIAIHGGAGPDSQQIKNNKHKIEEGLQDAIKAGYKILEKGGTALDAVEAAVMSLEDNPLFNAGRGSAINNKGEIEMDAAIMDGKKMKAGAVSMVKNVKNPIQLAKHIMDNTNHVLMSGYGALEVAEHEKIQLEPDAYFVTENQVNDFIESRDNKTLQDLLKERVKGTVGAVALDKNGNLASATSTGGTPNCLAGRIGDSCIIGCGCYANNKIAAISGTGDGEFLITGVIAHDISAAMEYRKCTIQEACEYVIHERNKDIEGDLGVISIDSHGNFGICFNSEHMHRAWMSDSEPLQVKIY